MACRTPPMPLRPMDLRRLRPGAVTMDTQRLILLFIFGFSVLMLWEAWEKEHRPKPAVTSPAASAQQGVPAPSAPASTGAAESPKPPVSAVPAVGSAAKSGETVRVTTDLLVADIDSL